MCWKLQSLHPINSCFHFRPCLQAVGWALYASAVAAIFYLLLQLAAGVAYW